jgi:NADPH:quinone reductase-like Zn-dependent oxidoreductase
VYVGPRRMHEKLARFVAIAGIHPVVDRVFTFDEAPEAFRHFDAGRHFGKVVVAAG